MIPYGNAVDGNIGGWLQTPDRNPALTMLEALGMQILHTEIGYGGDYYEAHFSAGWPAYNGSMSATDLKSSSGTYDYAVDFVLYDPRTALDIVSDAFAAAWPHPAIVAKQYAPYPITTLHYSYGHAAKILESVGAKLAAAAKVDPAATTCTVVTDVEGEHYRTTGLAPGEYACATPIEYDWCGTDLGGAVGAPWCESGHELVDGVCSQVSPPPPPHTATYTDGDGNTHVWHATKPKIVTGAFQALTLIDMGVDPAQIIGTFGERATSGSNVDGVYANYNIADHGDHAAAPYDPSHFLTDPSPAEKALLANMYDVSPTCSGTTTTAASSTSRSWTRTAGRTSSSAARSSNRGSSRTSRRWWRAPRRAAFRSSSSRTRRRRSCGRASSRSPRTSRRSQRRWAPTPRRRRRTTRRRSARTPPTSRRWRARRRGAASALSLA